ncbi:MAG: FtsX-like permease family protein [Thermoanaerobaculia bacterium]
MALPLPLLLALRYLKSSRRDAYVSILSLLAAAGITLGVAALILVLAGLSGLQDFLRSDILARTPHIEIEVPADGDSAALRDRLGAVDGVLEARRIVRGRGWLLAGGGVIDIEVVGYEGDLPAFFPGVASPETGLYIGDVLAARWGIEIGDLVEVVSARPTLTPLGPQPRLRQVRLVGTFRTGTTEDQRPRIAVPLDVARRLFGERQTRIELRTAGLEEALTVAEPVARELPEGSRVLTWKDLNRGLFFALKLEKVVMFVSVFLIVPIAAMALVTVLALLISSKRAEIGMLQAMGATRSCLRRAFFILGSSLGAAGLFLGCVLGVGGAWTLDRYRLISPPGDVYYLDHIPFLLDAGDLAAVVAATVFFVLVSTVWAARKAASSSPVEAWRD